jgi:hypothetical protein
LNELVALKRAGASAELVAAARERTRAMSIPADLLRQTEEGGVPQRALHADRAGQAASSPNSACVKAWRCRRA